MPATVNVSEVRPSPQVTGASGRVLWPLVVIIGAPLAIFPDWFPLPAVAIGLCLMLIPFAVRWVEEGAPTVLRPAMWPLLFLLLVSVPVSTRSSPVFEVYTWPELVRTLWGIGIFFAVANWCASARVGNAQQARIGVPDALATATAGFVGLGGLFGAVGLLALQASNKVPLLTQLVTQMPSLTSGPLGVDGGFNANRVAGLVVLYVPLCAILCLTPLGGEKYPGMRVAHWVGRAFLLVAFFFFGAVLVLTQSRTALLAAAIATPFSLLLAGRRGWIGLVLGGIVLAAVLSVFGPRQLVDELVVGRQDSAATTLWENVLADRNVVGRVRIWRRAIYGIRDEPLTGMGLGVFQWRALEPYPSLGWAPDPDITHAHNLLLQTGLDLGLPGMFAFMGFIVLIAADGVHLLRSVSPNDPMRLWSAAVCGSYMAFVIYNLTDAMTLGARPAFSYWYLFGLMAGAAALVRRRTPDP